MDEYFKGNIELINNLLLALAEEQIKTAFEQSEKEVKDLHSRISQGMRESKNQGVKIGLVKFLNVTTEAYFYKTWHLLHKLNLRRIRM